MHQKRQTAYTAFGKEMEAHEAKKHVEKFEKIIKHIEETTGLVDEEQVYHYLTTFKGKTASLKQTRDDNEARIEMLKEEHRALEVVRDGLVNRQVVSLDKMAAHLDRPIVNAEKKYRDYLDKFTKLQRLSAEVGTALSFIKDKISPIVPANITASSSTTSMSQPTTAQVSALSTAGAMTTIAEESEKDDWSGADAGTLSSDGQRNVNDRYERDAASSAGQGSEALAQMAAAERALAFAFELVNNPSLMMDEMSAKPASRRRPTSLLSSMYALREDSSSAAGGGSDAESFSTSGSLASPATASLATPSARRRSENNAKAASMRDRRSVYSSSFIGGNISSQVSSSETMGSSIDISKAPITAHNIRVSLASPSQAHAHDDDDYSEDGDSDDGGGSEAIVSLRQEPVRHARRESMNLGGSTALANIQRRRSVLKGISAAVSLMQ